MFRFSAVTLIIFMMLSSAGAAFGNGYGDYPPDLAWSPAENVLAASLNDRLLLWKEHAGVTTVAEGVTSSPAFSPDGGYAAFVMDREIYFFDVDHPGSVRKLAGTGEAVSCAFHPLGGTVDTVLLYTTDFLGSRLFVASLRTGGVLRLLPDDGEAMLNAPVPSPDGMNIACVNFGWTPGWYEELYIIGHKASEGARARASGTFRGSSDWHESNPVWLTEDLLLFQIGGWGEWELRFLSVLTGGEKILIDNAHQPCAALDGRFLAFCRNDHFPRASWGRSFEHPTAVWVMDRETGFLGQASEPGEWAEQPAISHDGEYIAWIEVLQEGEELKVFRSEAFISIR